MDMNWFDSAKAECDSFDLALAEERERLGRGLPMLKQLWMIAPMIGLLGTVLGIARVFDALKTLCCHSCFAGFSHAFLTTQASLVVSLVLFFAWKLYGWCLDAYMAKLERSLKDIFGEIRRIAQDQEFGTGQ